jgi:hypothetical protein
MQPARAGGATGRSRVLLAAVLALCSLAAAEPAAAQAAASPPLPSSRCAAFPTPPPLPDGATTTNRADIQRADAAFTAYSEATRAVETCRRAEADELMQAVRAHAARVAEFNDGVSRYNEVSREWREEIAEFNGRR